MHSSDLRELLHATDNWVLPKPAPKMGGRFLGQEAAGCHLSPSPHPGVPFLPLMVQGHPADAVPSTDSAPSMGDGRGSQAWAHPRHLPPGVEGHTNIRLPCELQQGLQKACGGETDDSGTSLVPG